MKLIAIWEGNGVGGNGGTTCSINALSINNTPPTGPNLSIPVPAGDSEIVVPNGAHLASDAQDTCQGDNLHRDVFTTFSTP